jgi:cell wall assembly regulator SMI1
MDQLWSRIEAWLCAHAPAIAVALNPPARAEDIEATERFFGVTFPDDVRSSYLRHDGQTYDSPGLLEGWEWLSLGRIRDEWGTWKDLLDHGEFEGIRSDGDRVRVVDDWWNPRWIPVTYSGTGDHHCLDFAPGPGGTPGQIIMMWHDDGARPVVAPGFGAWLARFADELEAGEFVLSDEYGGLCRREEL